MWIKNIKAPLAIGAMCLTLSLPVRSWSLQAPASKSTASAPASTTAPTPAEITDAKAKGLVWANTSTKIYHKSEDSKYGETKHGKFMTEADAIKAGYRLAKTSPIGHKKSTSTGPATN